MPIDLNNCDQACLGCVKGYKKKHDTRNGQKFEIECGGIPKDFVPLSVLASIHPDERKSAEAMLDPVMWAAHTLDWHCLDPDGEIWRRKNPEEYWRWVSENPGESIMGKSRYHRPYQAEMLRCSSKRKVFRIGRQSGKTETLVVSILYHMFTKPNLPENDGFKVIIITPYQAQIDIIFDRLNQLILNSPILKNSIKRSVKAPVYTIQLYNQSLVRGFTAGTKSGNNAAAVRGQHGHMLVFDEADYLNAADMEAAYSIITNHPGATVWMSSTPAGKRETFYKTCMSKSWKEYHFPSQVNPMWNDKLEAMFRESLTQIAYTHEILAEFGEQEEGVFQNTYVQAAKRQYKYGSIPHQHTWRYTVGVDWNDTKNGTTIAILGLDPMRNKFVLVDRHIVSREGWTQLAACEKIAEVNRLWKPVAIYLDTGYGGTQYEVLRKFGYDSRMDPTKGATHPDSRLPNVLKQYDFGSRLETRDIFSGIPMKKDAKPFLVESAVRRFEAQDIEFPSGDESLEAQLLGYIIDRITPTGRPVYRAANEEAGDHLLDAVMLAIVAFVLEMTPIGKPKYGGTGLLFTGGFGQKTEAQVHQGDVLVKPDIAHKNKEAREAHKPGQRGMPEQGQLFKTKDVPGANMNRGGSVGIWSWPGFGHDAPKPAVRSMAQAENDARKRMGFGSLRAGKPKRKNI